MMTVLTVRLDDETYNRLANLASKNRRTKSSYIKEMLEIYLEDFEDAYSALERLNQKNAKYLTTEEVEKKLGL
jgi:RHH-type rel operon transcriptional repressor/antitoxin RelB